MIATAETPEEMANAEVAFGQVYKTDDGPSNMPPMPPPASAAMDVDRTSGPTELTTEAAPAAAFVDSGAISTSSPVAAPALTKEEEQDIVDFVRQPHSQARLLHVQQMPILRQARTTMSRAILSHTRPAYRGACHGSQGYTSQQMGML